MYRGVGGSRCELHPLAYVPLTCTPPSALPFRPLSFSLPLPLSVSLPPVRPTNPLFPLHPSLTHLSVDHPCAASRTFARALRHSPSLTRLHYIQCPPSPAPSPPPPPAFSPPVRGPTHTSAGLLYVHCRRVRVDRIHMYNTTCTRGITGLWKSLPSAREPSLHRRRERGKRREEGGRERERSSDRGSEEEGERQRERINGCVFVCVLSASRYEEGGRAGGGWLCIYINT